MSKKFDLMEPTIGPGKFEGELEIIPYLWELCADGSYYDEEAYVGNCMGWAGYIRNLHDIPEIKGRIPRTYKAIILEEDSQGFVSGVLYDSLREADAAWRELAEYLDRLADEGNNLGEDY